MLVSGPTGVGKSTLLGVVTGLVPRFSGGTLDGDVLLDGVSIVRHAAARARARDRVRRPEPGRRASSPTPSRRSSPTAWSSSACRPRRCAAGSRRPSTCSASPSCAHRDLRTLSGGQQQRVAIGSVLTMHPRLLVLDEPTSALDPTAAEEVLATLTRLVHDLGVSVLLAEHRLERVVPFADRMCLLDRRRPGAAWGSPASCWPPRPSYPRSWSWAGPPAGRRCRSASATPGAGPGAWPTGSASRRRRRRRRRAPPSTYAGSRSSTASTVAVRDVDLGARRPGRVTALMGRNGSGKSSLIWALQGGGRRSGGQVSVDGADPAELTAADRRALVGLVPQNAADLLYLETVARGVRRRRRRQRRLPRAPRPAGARHPRRPAPARPLRGPAARARAGAGARRPAPGAAARRADPRPRLRREARARRHPARPRRRRPRGAGGHPRRGVRRARPPTTWWCSPRARSSRPGRCAGWSPSRRRSRRRSPRSSGRRGCGSTRSPRSSG